MKLSTKILEIIIYIIFTLIILGLSALLLGLMMLGIKDLYTLIF
ncbi:hypothetical protein RCL10_10890 [Staphylococcus lloydii]|nr:hypothetical protein [Staphylococcus lloydii]MDU9419003.1 hypothetical protein [Staphylococcus lloydii]